MFAKKKSSSPARRKRKASVSESEEKPEAEKPRDATPETNQETNPLARLETKAVKRSRTI